MLLSLLLRSVVKEPGIWLDANPFHFCFDQLRFALLLLLFEEIMVVVVVWMMMMMMILFL